MPHTTLSYYKLKSPASILNSALLFRYYNRAHVNLLSLLRWRPCLRLMRVILLSICVLIPLARPVQAQRNLAPTHIVLPGETLGLIAQSYGVDIYTLASLNGITNAHLIHTWQELAIPSSASYRQQSAIVSRGTHTVQRGETLDGIAKSYGLSLSDLIALNGISRFIYPGQQLALPVPGRAPAPVQSTPVVATSGNTHTVQYGETLGTIAAYYGISLYDLQAANNIWTWIIYVGQRLALPVPGRAPAPVQSEPIVATSGNTHTVQYGETLGTIAAYYGISLYDLQAANNIWTWIIFVGQQLVIPGGGTGAVIRETPATPSDANAISNAFAAPTISRAFIQSANAHCPAWRDPFQDRSTIWCPLGRADSRQRHRRRDQNSFRAGTARQQSGRSSATDSIQPQPRAAAGELR